MGSVCLTFLVFSVLDRTALRKLDSFSMITVTSNKAVTFDRAGAGCYVTLEPLSSYALRASAFGSAAAIMAIPITVATFPFLRNEF